MKNQGFTLLEVLVSLTLVAIVTTTMTNSALMNARTNNSIHLKLTSATIAQEILDSMRTLNQDEIQSLPSTSGTTTTQTKTVDGKTFTVNTVYCLNTAFCDTDMRHITLRILYRGIQVYEIQTIYSSLNTI